MENAEVNTTSAKKKGHRRKAGGKRKKETNNSHDRSMETMSDDPADSAAALAQPEVHALREDGEPPRKHVKMMPEREKRKRQQQQQHPQHALMSQKFAHRHPAPGRRNPNNLLRPSTVPKAPQNSTQFIIGKQCYCCQFIQHHH